MVAMTMIQTFPGQISVEILRHVLLEEITVLCL